MKIGVPKALLWHNFSPALKGLTQASDAEFIYSSDTNKTKLERGLAACDDEVCLPVKVFMGHVDSLVNQGVDALFVPRFISLESKRYLCPKFLGLPDVVKSHYQNKVPVLSPTINLNWGRLRQVREAFRTAGPWLKSPLAAWRALDRAAQEQRNFHQQLAAALTQSAERSRVAVLGHSYNVLDEYINFGLLGKLRELGVEPITLENIPRKCIEAGARQLKKDLFWNYGRDLVGAAYWLLESKAVDGVILVVSFGCGPDSLIKELIERRYGREGGLPLMSLILDEHASGTGMVTRLEAFTDMLSWRDAQ